MFGPATTNPRPILKHHHQQHPTSYHAGSSDASRPHCAVRFPSSPKISTVHFTHCASTYDRRPIVVLPNSCELPDRGCRDYNAGPASASPHTGQTQSWAGNHVHPSILLCRDTNGSSSSSEDDHYDVDRGRRRRGSMEDSYEWYSGPPPPLTHDDASSEESDGIASPPPEQCSAPTRIAYYVPPSQSHLHSEPLSHPPIPDALSFLPHAPSPSAKKQRSEKKRSSWEVGVNKRLSATTTAGSFSWSTSEEDSSCLGGF